MTGHHSRSYRYDKRTHLNQELGPFIGHEMNRCIACYRCVRYYKDYAGGTDLGVYGAAANVYFGRPQDGTLESEFSGNLTEVCPTGVFTDKTHSERYNRKWDMQYAPSICTGCAVGCNVSPGERYGEIRRIENRYNGELNGYFLCDRGRFGYGYTNRKDRPRRPLLKRDGAQSRVDSDIVLEQARILLVESKRLIGIGSPRASLEANFALRALVGADNFHSGTATVEAALDALVLKIQREGAVPVADIRAIESADAAFVLGEDVTSTASRIALALRQTARGKARDLGAQKNVPEWQVIALADLVQRDVNPVFIASVEATRLDDIARETYRAAPEDLARLGHAVAHCIDTTAPSVPGLDEATAQRARRIADALLAARQPLVVSGTGTQSAAVIEAAANVARALHQRNAATRLTLTVAEANSLGLAMMAPQPLDAALQRLARGEADALIVLENDLYRRAPKAAVDAALAGKARVIVVDHQATPTAAVANVVLPAATVFEGDGTFVNFQGRAQRYFQVFEPAYYDAKLAVTESWRWIARIGQQPWDTLDDITAATAAALPALAGIIEAAPNAKFRIDGLKIAREPHRYSGRTAMRANQAVSEIRQPQDADTALAFSMEGYQGTGSEDRPAALTPFAWSPGWNSPSAWNKFQDEVGGHLRGGDAGKVLFGAGAGLPYFTAVPAAAAAGGLRLLALRQAFGTEELSQRAAPIRERSGEMVVTLNAVDAARLGVNGHARVEVDGQTLTLATRLSETLPSGHVGLPAGAAGIPYFVGGTSVTVSGA
jgi:NADH-quinone oxidoreductase subunit G